MYAKILIALVLAPGALLPQPPQAKPARLSGVVVNTLTGEPVRKVQVRLSKESGRGGPPATAAVTTDATGRFVFDGLQGDTYRLSAQKPGFLTMQYGARRGSSRGTPLKLDPGQELDVQFKILPQGVIAGRVLDEDGDPIAGANVSVSRITASAQSRDDGVSTATNDLGDFRIPNLPPGRYLVLAYSQGRRFGERLQVARRAEPEREYAPTYYPGSLDASGAAAVDVSAGRESSGIQFALAKTPVYRVRGKVIASSSALPQNLTVFLTPRKRTAGRRGGPGGGGRVRPDGSFELSTVRPGAYSLVASDMGRGPRAMGRADLDVTGDIENASVTLSPPISLSGTVRIEGQPSAADFGRGRIFLRPVDSSPGGGTAGEVKPDGSFRIDGLTPERYLVIPFGFASNLFLRSVRLGNQPIAAELDLSLAAAGVPLSIVLSPNAATITGTVKEKDVPAGGVQVSLLPDPMEQASAWRVKQATTDQNGGFTLQGVAPGSYRLYALPEPALAADLDPEFLKAWAAKATRVEVKESSSEQVEAQLIDPDPEKK